MSEVRDASELPADAPAAPVVIVGAGACGLTAAIALRDAGIECVGIERDAQPRGSTGLSSGFIPAALTRWQRDAGVADSAAAFAADIHAKSHGRAAAHLVAAYTAASAPALDLLDRHGLRFELLDGFLYPGHSVRRMHTLRERTGAVLIGALDAAARAAGVDLLCDALVRTVYARADGRIAGIGWQRPDGSRESLRCDVLLLACNGFGGDAALVAELIPSMRGAPFAGHVGNDGTAVRLGRALGARLADLSGFQGHGSWIVPHGALMSWAVMTKGGIQVNRDGRRFHDETGGYSEAAARVLAQRDGIAFNMFDDAGLALAREFPDFRDAEAGGARRTLADAKELAAWIGCDAAPLRDTLGTARLAPPFHAAKVTGALFHTQGGVDIDAACRVLRHDGSPFPNWLAAGGAARGVSGDRDDGYLSGNGLLSAVAGGWIAAGTAAANLKERHR